MGLALITGASSGIGAEFARLLAARGYDLALSARRGDRLTALGEELAGRHGVKYETVVADLSGEQGIATMEARLRQGDVDLLVNNAGFGIGKKFAHADLAGQQAMVNVHMVAPMRLMRAALPAMIERRRGGVINVASLAAFLTLPGNANYCATKAYLMRFSLTVDAEVRGKGVSVQALCPGFVTTEFHDEQERVGMDRRGPAFMWLPAAYVVGQSLAAYDRRKSLVVPGFGYKLVYWLAKTGLPDALIPLVAR
jgi:short-subunit dehydrogenase